MNPERLQRVTSIGLWGGMCGLFSFLVASGNLFLGAAILSLLLLYIFVLIGPQFIVSLWLIGSPTVFNLANQVLKAMPFLTMERLLFVMLTGIILLRAVFIKTRQTGFSRLEILILLFLGYILASLIMTATADTWRRDVWFFLQYAMPMLMFMISRRMSWSETGVKVLLAALTLTGVAVATMGVLQGLFGVSIFTQEYQTVTHGHIDRAHGAFTSAETYIAALFIFLMLTLYQFTLYRDALVRAGLLVVMLLILVGIVLGKTRAPWIGAALALLIIFVRDRQIRPLLVVGGALASVAGVVLFIVMFHKLGAFIERLTDLYTIANRLTLWATAANMVAHNPLFGIGFGADAFMLHKREYITGFGDISAQYATDLGVPHNQYLHVASLLGLVGLCAFLMILFGFARFLYRMQKDPLSSPMQARLAIYVGAIWAGLMFNSLFSDTYVQDYFWVLAYFLVGLVAGMQREPVPGGSVPDPGDAYGSPAPAYR